MWENRKNSGTEGTENTGGTVNERGAYTYVAVRTAIVTRMSRGRSKVIIFHVRACACLYRVVRSRRGIANKRR